MYHVQYECETAEFKSASVLQGLSLRDTTNFLKSVTIERALQKSMMNNIRRMEQTKESDRHYFCAWIVKMNDVEL
jgi:hypothetical protein